MNYQGKIKQWNDKKGFGFIQEKQSTAEIFAHISAFHVKNPRPEIGEEVSFNVITNAKGKKEAQNIRRYRHGVELTESARTLSTPSPTPDSCRTALAIFRQKLVNAFRNLMIFLVLIAGAYLIYTYFPTDFFKKEAQGETVRYISRSATNAAQTYQCDGRTHCSQMRSCEEAQYFLTHCPNTKMDGDNDGIACEQQWCN